MHTDLADSLWPEMVRLYAREHVSELCLSLQDEFDVDVPVLLFLVLTDRNGIGCDEHAFGRFLVEAARWRECVVRPLRTIRRAMKKHVMTTDESALREEIKRIELNAEKLHVSRLANAFPEGNDHKGTLAERYLTDRGLSADRRKAITALFRDVLPDITADREPPCAPNQPDRTRKAIAS